jgi:hypothetical protein
MFLLPSLVRAMAPEAFAAAHHFLSRWAPLICSASFLVAPHLAMVAALRVGHPTRVDALRAYVVSGPSSRIPLRAWIRLGVLVASSIALLAAAFSAPSEVFGTYRSGSAFCRHAGDCERHRASNATVRSTCSRRRRAA